MFLTVHTATGILIGQHIHNPLLAFILAFVSHFFLDLLPHGDNKWLEDYKNGKKIKKMVNVVIVDAACAIVLLGVLYPSQILIPSLSVAAAIIGSVLPDMFVGIFELTKKYFKRFNKFHITLHNLIKFDFSFAKGFVFQVIILIVLITNLW